MINTVLGKITAVWQKDFLLGSLLPALLFFLALSLTTAAGLGFEASAELLSQWATSQPAVLSGSGLLALFVFGYALSTIRTPLLEFWSGRHSLLLFNGFIVVGEAWQRHKFFQLRAASSDLSPWHAVLQWFQDESRKQWGHRPGKEVPESEKKRLIRVVEALHDKLPDYVVEIQLGQVIQSFKKYDGNSLTDVYQVVKRSLTDWNKMRSSRARESQLRLDRRFAPSVASVRATRLGNIIESYNQYPSSRYRIESELFWPRLRKVIDKDFWKQVEDARIFLDFSVAMTSLGAAYGVVALAAGPWLRYEWLLWFPLAIAGALVCMLFYWMSTVAANQLGEMIRSSFDLFRLELMHALQWPRPTTLDEERKQWTEVSRLIAYGNVESMAHEIRPRGN